MAKTTIFEQHQSGGTAAFLVTGTDTIDFGTELTDAINTTVGDGAATYTNSQISITKIHWSAGTTIQITDDGGSVDFTLNGNAAWCQFNGWTPVVCDKGKGLAITFSGTGSLFIEVKKLSGFPHSNDYSNTSI